MFNYTLTYYTYVTLLDNIWLPTVKIHIKTATAED